jgi:hypothetical protein
MVQPDCGNGFLQVQAEGYGSMTNFFSPYLDGWNLAFPITCASCIGTAPYDCKGSTLCSTTNLKYHDKAVNSIPAPRSANNITSNIDSSSLRWANAAGFGCRVFVQGTREDGSNCD